MYRRSCGSRCGSELIIALIDALYLRLLRVRTDQPAMGRFSPGSALLLILVSTVSVVYFHSKRCHCYKFQRRSYSKYGSKFIPQTGTFSELATRGRQICLTKTTANEKSLRLGSKARVFCGSQRRVALCR